MSQKGFSKVIKNSESLLLSSQDILRITKGDTHIVIYDDLTKFSSIEELLHPHSSVVLLYQSSEKSGHWCCLLINAKGNLEFFDPYGLSPDTQFKYLGSYGKGSGIRGLLSKLMLNYEGEIEYNSYALQKSKKDITSCGRWCGFRILCKDIPLENFINGFIKSGIDPDFLVTAFTMFI